MKTRSGCYAPKPLQRLSESPELGELSIFRERWPPFCLHGKAYLLDHLNRQVIIVGANRIAVMYSSHCVTKGVAVPDPSLSYDHGDNTARDFCFERYELSKGLGDHVLDCSGGHITQTHGHRKYLMIPKANSTYNIIFSLEKSNRGDEDMIMRIVSAYPSSDIPRGMRMRFTHLMSRVMNGK